MASVVETKKAPISGEPAIDADAKAILAHNWDGDKPLNCPVQGCGDPFKSRTFMCRHLHENHNNGTPDDPTKWGAKTARLLKPDFVYRARGSTDPTTVANPGETILSLLPRCSPAELTAVKRAIEAAAGIAAKVEALRSQERALLDEMSAAVKMATGR